jgi:BirA family biotin operon repressor/biotin-[acetyl-CoA-carboxylase] ligase
MGEVAEIATSIREAVGHEVERAKFTANLIKELEIWYQKFLKEGKSLIIKEWTERFGAINRRVRVKFNGNEIQGIALGVDENGYLTVRKDDGVTEKIIAGDVILL